MKNRKDSPISFGITLTSSKRTRSKNFNRRREIPPVCLENNALGKIDYLSVYDFDCPRMKMPPPDKLPFTPDMFNCVSMRLPTFPPSRKMTSEEERIHNVLKQYRSSTTASHHTSGNSSLTVLSAAWEFFKVVFFGVFVALKYAFIAVAVIITIGCMICAGRQSSGLR